MKDKGMLSTDSLLSLTPRFTLDELDLEPEEIASYLEMSEGLRLIKNKWVEVDHNKFRDLLARYESLKTSFSDSEREPLVLLKSLLNKSEDLSFIDGRRFLREFTQRISSYKEETVPALPATFLGELRPYQEKGRSWLHHMRHLYMGVCLADDMGLGKTIQVLAFLEGRRLHNETCLLILPMSLIGNREREIKNFAPNLSYEIYHGQQRKTDADLVITTYGTLRKDKLLPTILWDGVILDEAQAIKNPSTSQSKAVKALEANMRIALTGTPIENSLFDLFSQMDFLNPGLLGTLKEFKKLANSLDKDREGYKRLRSVVSPFILRRLKTDPEIIPDLPEKNQIKEHVELTPKQLLLYKKRMMDFKRSLAEKEGIQRKGHILSTLQNLKQIVNHPSQYTGDGLYKPADSAKFKRLGEICETIHERRESVLLFTQYRELTEPLAHYLETIFKKKASSSTVASLQKSGRKELNALIPANISLLWSYP